MGLSVTVLGCDGSYAGPGGACSGYLVSSGDTHVWLDCGPGTLANLQQHLDPNKPFLWIDESSDRALRIRRGEAIVAPGLDRGTRYVPNGRIHHWIGAIFTPNASMENLLSVLHDYDSYRET